MLSILKQIKNKAKKHKKTIVLPESDERILKAAKLITKNKIANIVLITKKQIKGITCLHPSTHKKTNLFIKQFYKQRKHKGITLKQAEKAINDPVYFGMMLVKNNLADGIVSGATHTTSETLKAAIQTIQTKKKFQKVSGVFLMQLKKQLLIFADAAVEICPDSKDLADIAISTANTAKFFNITPRIAMLSFSTNSSARHPLVDKVKEATAIVKHKKPKIIIEGEMQVDAALVPDVCKRKFPKSKIMGNANTLIFPDLNTANVAYKLVQRLAKARAVGPILQGFKKPVNDLSRGCDAQDIVDLVAITAVQAEELK